MIESQKKVEAGSPMKKKVIKPNMLPFKGDINQNELNILNRIHPKSKAN